MKPQDLKNSLLQLAIQGKLVPQDPAEGTGEDLYQQIQREKQALVKAGKIKKEKALPAISEDEIPFEIPESWKWVRLGEITQLITKGSSPNWQGFSYTEKDKGILFITSENVGREELLMNKEKYVSSNFNDAHTNSILRYGDILTNIVGASIGRTALFDLDINNANINQAVCIIRLVNNQYNSYIVKYLNSDNAIQLMLNKTVDCARANLSLTSIANLLLPLPPLSEQRRIVSKLEEIFPHIAQFEQLQGALYDLRDDLRKSLLQYAIEGKLVAQDPAEGTGEDLYQQIQREKQALVKAGKIKKEKALPAISEDEIPFEIPETWKWVRLGEMVVIERGGSPRPISAFLTNDPNGINWIKIGDTDIGGKYINSSKEKIIPEGMKKSRFVHKGDFLLSNSMSFGRPYILNIDGCIHDGWLVLRNINSVFDKDYLYYILSSTMVYVQFCNRVSGAVVNNLNSDKVALTLLPLPPLSEQRRIVSKLEEIFALLNA